MEIHQVGVDERVGVALARRVLHLVDARRLQRRRRALEVPRLLLDVGRRVGPAERRSRRELRRGVGVVLLGHDVTDFDATGLGEVAAESTGEEGAAMR